jgi:hypothetical protein
MTSHTLETSSQISYRGMEHPALCRVFYALLVVVFFGAGQDSLDNGAQISVEWIASRWSREQQQWS